MYECEFEDSCPDSSECNLKFHRIWAVTCEKWQEFQKEKGDEIQKTDRQSDLPSA